MNLYHFSDGYFEPGCLIPIGNFRKTIEASSSIVQEFEKLMEDVRVKLGGSTISRLDCLFTFPLSVAEGFQTKRKFLYELDIQENAIVSSHNHEIGTYFSKLFCHNDIDLLTRDLALMYSYWNNENPSFNWNGELIDYREEILVSQPVVISRRIDWAQ